MFKIPPYFIIILIISSCHNISFESDKWKDWEENEVNQRTRLDMTNDLIDNYQITGKTKDEILKLLGEPDNKYKNNKNVTFSYNLGPCREFGISYGVLILEIEEGSVTEIKKHCH